MFADIHHLHHLSSLVQGVPGAISFGGTQIVSDIPGDLNSADSGDATREAIVKKLWLADDVTGVTPGGLTGSDEGAFGHYAINAYWPNTAIIADNLRGLGESGFECPDTWDGLCGNTVHADTTEAYTTA